MKKIKFLLQKDYDSKVELISPPSPASQHVPKWYKDGEMYLNARTGLIDIDDPSAVVAGLKTCNPFLDAISSGYMLTTWVDIEITKNYNNEFEFKYLEKDKNDEYIESVKNWDMVSTRKGDIGHTIPRPNGYSHVHLVWAGKWGIQVPKGWSILLTHPLNQNQFPFYTLSGLMDSDRFFSQGNIPFFIQEGWTGIIPKGTPFAQLIPIKRSSWLSVNVEQDDFSGYLGNQAREFGIGYYRQKLWVPKKYK